MAHHQHDIQHILREGQDRGYLGRILMLTLLAPDIVEAIPDGRQPAGLDVNVLRKGFPMEWGEQRMVLAGATPHAAGPAV